MSYSVDPIIRGWDEQTHKLKCEIVALEKEIHQIEKIKEEVLSQWVWDKRIYKLRCEIITLEGEIYRIEEKIGGVLSQGNEREDYASKKYVGKWPENVGQEGCLK